MKNLKINKVMLFNGSCISVKDIMPGDIVMAPEGKGKIVSEVRKGYGKIFKVSSSEIKDYYVNIHDNLELICDSPDGITLLDGQFIKNHEIIQIPVLEYLKQYPLTKKALKLRKAKADFMSKREHMVKDPYLEGSNLHNREIQYIPNIYLRNDRIIRQQYLAGIIDSNGITDGNEIHIPVSKPSKEIKKMLIKDILFLCHSLGLNASFQKDYIRIYGILSDIPFRKKHLLIDTQDSNLFSTYVNPVGEGDYYTFDLLDEDKRYLLYDCTVSLAEHF